jgi:ABC-2 type transport system permease protein
VKPALDISLLYRRYALQLVRNPVWLFVGFSTPLLYLALFTPLLKHLTGASLASGGHVLDGFLPAILALLAFATGTGSGFTTIFELQAGVIERLRVTPTSRLAILISTGPAWWCSPCCSACSPSRCPPSPSPPHLPRRRSAASRRS